MSKNRKIAELGGVRLAGTSVMKTATILDALGVTVSKFMSVYTNHG
jgi:orotate phosphoribosyltransferase